MAGGNRVKVIMACLECKNRNYNYMKNKRVHPDRMELKKHCPTCNSHTVHKESR
jgi:large subunit ribosomal protein L33